MPSSISSSKNMNQKSVNNKWWITWLMVLIICCISLGSYELFLKKRGFSASIENNNDLWSWYRSKINNNPKSLVFIGASRSQLDINLPYLKHRLENHDVFQLSINGHYPMATLKALAEDENFNGTLIVSFTAQALESFYFDMQAPQNNYFVKKSTLYKSADAYVTALLKSNLRVLHPLLGLKQIVEFYDVHKVFQPAFYTTANLDQSVSGNYSLTDAQNLYNHFVSEKEKNYNKDIPTTVDVWVKNIDLLVQYNRAIKNRGGTVVFVRFPTYKGHWDLDEKYYPRKLYWDKIAQQPSLNTLHFKDVGGLDQFVLPDSSHLDQKDSKKFTQVLLDEFIKRKFFN